MKSYFKFLSRNKLYTAIEAAGLIVSLAFVLLIGAYARHQWRTAHGAPAWKHYYALSNVSYTMVDMAPQGLAFLIKENLPAVDQATMFSYRHVDPTVDGEPAGETGMATVEPDFFEMFPVEWVEGDMRSLLGGGVAISERLARKFAKDGVILDRQMVSWGQPFTIAAVFRSQPAALFNELDFLQVKEWKELSPGAAGGDVCLISSNLPEDELAAALDLALEEHGRKQWGRDESRTFKNGCIERMDRLYFADLNGGMAFHKGNLSLLRMLFAVVILLLLSAVFNYINLSAALAGKRTKEMGMRAILGATRGQIVRKYLLESLVFTFVCAGAAILVARAFAPMLSDFLETRRGARFVSAPFSWQLDLPTAALFVGVALVTGLLAGWIPSRMASRYNSVQVVKGDYRLRSKRVFSKIFIVFQTALSVLLVAFALVMERQYSHMIHQPVGADVEDMFVQSILSEPHANAVRELPFVKASGWANGFPGHKYMSGSGPGKDGVGTIALSVIAYDVEAFKMCGYEVLEDFHTPQGAGVWLSESAWNGLGLEPGEQTLPKWANFFGFPSELAGVLKDFATDDAAHIQQGSWGVIVVYNELQNGNTMLLRIDGDKKAAKKQLAALYERFIPEATGYVPDPTDNGYVEDKVKKGLAEAENYMRMIELFMGLSLLISLLGLLAMSAFFAGGRTHDVAVRKVFGGTVGGEVVRGVWEYMLLVGIACVLAVPVAIWLAERYLADYNYRISGYSWIFAVAVAIALVISFLAVLWQTLKAAKTNPAVELKKE